jgi:hypothetical protein
MMLDLELDLDSVIGPMPVRSCQHALVEMAHHVRALGGDVVVRDHDDGLVELAR